MDQQPVCSVDLSGAPADVIRALLGHMDLKQRFTCALVCRDWARAAPAATRSISRHGKQDLEQLQQWLDKHGGQVETLQLHKCTSTLARLPCAQLQDLLLNGSLPGSIAILSSRVWSDIAAATKLTSVSLVWLRTESEQADVVSALTALPDLQQLTWWQVICGRQQQLSDSRLLQKLTRLTGLEIPFVAAEALQHLSLLTKLQHLSTHPPLTWAADGYPGLQELRALTSLVLHESLLIWRDEGALQFPACVSNLTALQQLEVSWATFPELNGLTALTALTKLHVAQLSPGPTPLLLPALQHLKLTGKLDELFNRLLHMSSLASCTQLRCLSLRSFDLRGSLVASSMLQELDLKQCSLSSGGDGPGATSPWQLIFPGPGRLPHLTSLVLQCVWPEPRQADVEQLATCCNGLRVLQLECEQFAPRAIPGLSAVATLPHLTKLHLGTIVDEQCSALAQLRWFTGLQELQVLDPHNLSAAGLRHLASLKQLTSLGLHVCFDIEKVGSRARVVLQEQLSDTLQDCGHALVNKAPSGSPPDVSARLLRACDLATAAGEQQH